MGNLNKIISLVIGLITVAVFFAVLTGRINLRERFNGSTAKKTITPTPTRIRSQARITPTPTLAYVVNRYQNGNNQGKNITQIPSTGIPMILTSGLLASLSIGIYLRRKK